MRILVISGAMALALAGCAQIGGLADRVGLGGGASADPAAPADPFVSNPPEAALAPETAAPPPSSTARTAEALDTTTPEQRAAATAAPAEPVSDLGTTVVSLGAPTEPGLWLKTPLVDSEVQGRVTNPANGKSSLVTLIPLDGPATAGSRMSLAAMRLIDLSLTDLTEVQVALEG